MSRRAIVSPESQSATFVELFFDLVFVFGITQVVHLLHDDLTWAGVGRSALVFWLLWWAWTQFTWALNAADTTHPIVEFATLLATAIAFFMAVSIPNAFEDGGPWFAVPYVMVRVLGLSLYVWVTSSKPEQRRAVITFATLSTLGLAAVVWGGYTEDAVRLWLWGGAIALDILAAAVGGRSENWNLHPEHFAERHGLIVIIALGESLIVAASGLVITNYQGDAIRVALPAVLVSCALWWTYFPVAKPQLERALGMATGNDQSSMARDAFSLAHFPMLCGVIAYAAALEEAVLHPQSPLGTADRLSMALGLLLFVTGTALAVWRATGRMPLIRVVVSAVTAGAVFYLEGMAPIRTLVVALVGLGMIALADEFRANRFRVAV